MLKFVKKIILITYTFGQSFIFLGQNEKLPKKKKKNNLQRMKIFSHVAPILLITSNSIQFFSSRHQIRRVSSRRKLKLFLNSAPSLFFYANSKIIREILQKDFCH